MFLKKENHLGYGSDNLHKQYDKVLTKRRGYTNMTMIPMNVRNII